LLLDFTVVFNVIYLGVERKTLVCDIVIDLLL